MALSSASASSASAAQATDADGCAAATMAGVLAGEQFGLGLGVAGQQDRIGSQEISHRRHGSIVQLAACRATHLGHRQARHSVAKLCNYPTKREDSRLMPKPSGPDRGGTPKRRSTAAPRANRVTSRGPSPTSRPDDGATEATPRSRTIRNRDRGDQPDPTRRAAPKNTGRVAARTSLHRPGFDAKETAIIAPPPEPATEVFADAAGHRTAPASRRGHPKAAVPQSIPPRLGAEAARHPGNATGAGCWRWS